MIKILGTPASMRKRRIIKPIIRADWRRTILDFFIAGTVRAEKRRVFRTSHHEGGVFLARSVQVLRSSRWQCMVSLYSRNRDLDRDAVPDKLRRLRLDRQH
jgi:hypothetical protein